MMQHEPQLAVLEGVVVPVTQQRASGPALDGCVAGGVRAKKLQYGPTLASIRSPHAR